MGGGGGGLVDLNIPYKTQTPTWSFSLLLELEEKSCISSLLIESTNIRFVEVYSGEDEKIGMLDKHTIWPLSYLIKPNDGRSVKTRRLNKSTHNINQTPVKFLLFKFSQLDENQKLIHPSFSPSKVKVKKKKKKKLIIIFQLFFIVFHVLV